MGNVIRGISQIQLASSCSLTHEWFKNCDQTWLAWNERQLCPLLGFFFSSERNSWVRQHNCTNNVWTNLSKDMKCFYWHIGNFAEIIQTHNFFQEINSFPDFCVIHFVLSHSLQLIDGRFYSKIFCILCWQFIPGNNVDNLYQEIKKINRKIFHVKRS